MPMLDIFKNDAFSIVSLTDAINKMPFQPGYLLGSGLFRSAPGRTRTVAIESKAGKLSLIQTVAPGAPPRQADRDRRNVRNFTVPRLYKADKLMATEIAGARAFGSETEVETMQAEMAVRMNSLLADLLYTYEYHLLGALQGNLLDADGSVIYNWFSEWGITAPTDIAFTSGAITAAGGMRAFLQESLVRPMLRAAQVGNAPGITVKALCGDQFFDFITNHPDVKETYLNYQAAAELRNANAFGEFFFGGVTFVNYRGSDDTTTIGIPSDECQFFLNGIPGLFQLALAPIDTFDFVNTLARQFYARTLIDEKRNEFVDLEVESNPLAICTRPETLLRGAL
jgi:hypothetical protein